MSNLERVSIQRTGATGKLPGVEIWQVAILSNQVSKTLLINRQNSDAMNSVAQSRVGVDASRPMPNLILLNPDILALIEPLRGQPGLPPEKWSSLMYGLWLMED